MEEKSGIGGIGLVIGLVFTILAIMLMNSIAFLFTPQLLAILHGLLISLFFVFAIYVLYR